MAKGMFTKGFISRADLYLAYRKAKADAFYDNLHPNAIAFAEYEQDLKTNLESLLNRLVSSKVEWPLDLGFIGGYLYIPKSIDFFKRSKVDDVHCVDVDPIRKTRVFKRM
ncbi:hypothetical protein GCM10007052_29980 [Halioglobus japonicus]|nr:hypothetical protein GCM10007052_29980 [Halioglobus japonicus]